LHGAEPLWLVHGLLLERGGWKDLPEYVRKIKVFVPGAEVYMRAEEAIADPTSEELTKFKEEVAKRAAAK